MNEEELGRLLVRLLGDSSDFKAMMGDAKKDLADAEKKVEDASKGVGTLQGKLESLAAAGVAAFGALKAADWLRDVESAYEGQFEADRKLRAALKIQGREVDALSSQYMEFAAEMQRTANVEDDAVEGMLKMAEMMGVTGEQAQRAVKNAIALASAHGGVADSYIRQTIALENGRVGRIGMLLGMGELEEGADKAAEAQKKLAGMFEMVGEDMKSMHASAKSVSLAYGDLKEEFGKVIVEAIHPLKHQLNDTIKTLTAWISATPGWVKTTVVVVAGLTAAFAGLTAAIAAFAATKGTILAVAGAMKVLSLAFLTNPVVAWTTVIVLAGVALYKLMGWATGSAKAMKEFNNELKVSAQLADEMARKQEAQQSRTMEGIGFMAGPERFDALGAEKDRLDKELQGVAARIRSRQKEVDDLQELIRTGNPLKIMDRMVMQKAEQQQIDEDTKRLGALKDAIGDINKELAKKPSGSLVGAFAAMTPEIAEAAGAVAELNQKGKDLQATYASQLTTFGMASREAEIYKLELKGLDEATLHMLKTQDRLLTQMEAQQKAMEEAKAIAEEFATPQEKLESRMARLNELFRSGELGPIAYERAMADAKSQLEQTAEATAEMSAEVQRLDAVLSGGAEAKERIANYRAMLETQDNMRLAKNPSPPNAMEAKRGVDVLIQIRDAIFKQAERDVIEVEVEDLE